MVWEKFGISEEEWNFYVEDMKSNPWKEEE